MSDIAQFTSVFRAHTLSDQQRRVTKRNRQPVSCSACRSRKLKCDRAQPCGACTRRGDAHACRFGPKVAGQHTAVSNNGKETRASAPAPVAAQNPSHDGVGEPQKQPRQEVQLRLQKLEDMVQDLVRRGSGPSKDRCAPPDIPAQAGPTPTDSDPGRDEHSPPPAPVDGEEAYYGATHWSALLHHIREIQTALEPDHTVPPEQPPGTAACSIGPDFLFGAVPPSITIQDVLASLPPRQDTDRLLSIYFRARFTAVPFIHTGRFQRECEAFWANPDGASFLWISILFSIITTATVIIRGKGPAEALGLSSSSLQEPSAYSGRAVQCLVKGNYLAAKTYSVEATLLVAYTRNIASRDHDPVMWNMFGVATRLAQRRGYHLEPRHLSYDVSPFDAEMRRRTWFYCETFDLLLSFQLGMPPIIHEGESDALGPGNHPDEDFDETTVSMPPPRPALDPSPMLYYNQKSKLCRILRRVIRHALSPSEPAYAETRALDEALHAWRAGLPACLAVRPIRSTGFSEQNYTIMHRLMLELMFSKALCVLHRRYLSRDKKEACYAGSRETCRRAALRVLELHEEFDREASPGGRLFEDRYMLSSLALHDFMIAAMVVALDLNESADTGDEDYERKMNALRTAARIWDGRSNCSRDARYAAAVLRAMLRRLSRREMTTMNVEGGTTTTASGVPLDPAITTFGDLPASDVGFVDVAPGLGGLQGVDMFPGDSVDFMTLDNALNDPVNLDWTLLDQYLSKAPNGELSMDLSM
ncbi:hypothetical protein CkaCkLH20_00396 [Colletotrichum karsti]|uniref:Zn(2)-C6 fungal-type domain-containing protein n=1 Tax=Colletotrichum karsti TaxID=1095194 RepID=A0A9P6LQL0_9PEZI|nr:uncharacterized protein CkaCkLH20_00396 [Colletotrichum karsti]KAF9882360.1 hypothetical protein CkaCkLH20_00396 [Colletotrichum karsti]